MSNNQSNSLVIFSSASNGGGCTTRFCSRWTICSMFRIASCTTDADLLRLPSRLQHSYHYGLGCGVGLPKHFVWGYIIRLCVYSIHITYKHIHIIYIYIYDSSTTPQTGFSLYLSISLSLYLSIFLSMLLPLLLIHVHMYACIHIFHTYKIINIRFPPSPSRPILSSSPHPIGLWANKNI